MATLIVSDVDEAALEQLRCSLEAQGSSVEAEVRAMIADRARASLDQRRQRAREAMAQLQQHAENIEATYGAFPDSTEMLRQDRDIW